MCSGILPASKVKVSKIQYVFGQIATNSILYSENAVADIYKTPPYLQGAPELSPPLINMHKK